MSELKVSHSVAVTVDVRCKLGGLIRVEADRTVGTDEECVWITANHEETVRIPLADAEAVADALRAVAERYLVEVGQ